MFNLWFEKFNGVGDLWAVWMATATIEALVLLLIVGTIWLLVRRRVAPQVGVWLFLLVPLKLLVPIQLPAPALIADWTPSAIAAKLKSPQIPASELPLQISENKAFAQQQQSETPEANSVTSLPAVASVPQDVAQHISGDPSGTASLPAASSISENSILSLNLATYLMIAWAIAVSFLGLRFLVREIRFRQHLNSATPLAKEDLKLDFQTLSQSAGVHRPVRLLCAEAVTAPAVHGILRPTIILPTLTLEQLSPAQLRWALLHELSHVRRYDLVFILLQRVVSWLFFFHPAIWIANRTVHQLREFACDDWAILQTEPTQNDTRSTDAGEAFLQILRSASEQPHNEVALSVLGLGPRESCQQRLQRMLDTDRRIKPGPGWISICGLLLIAAVTLPQLSAAGPEEPAAEPATTQTDKDAENESNTKTPPEDAWRFDLRVVGTDGNLVPKAQLLFNDYRLPEVKQVLAGKQGEKNKIGFEFECDAEGKLSIQFSHKPTVFRFYIETDGYGPYVAWWQSPNLANQIPQQFTAELVRAWTIAGRVVDEGGNPIPNTKVSLRLECKKRPGDQRQHGAGGRLVTDADGRWISRRVPISVNSVYAEINSENHQPKTATLFRKEFEAKPDNALQSGGTIVLSQGLTLSGKVSNDQGEPVEGAEVRVRFLNSVRRATSAMDGRYEIGGCDPGKIEALITAPGMAIDKKEISIAPDSDDVDFVIKPSKGIRIRVIDEAGKPLARSRILFQKWRGDYAFSVLDEVNQYADDDGFWEWKEAPLDEFTADICRPKGMNLSGQKLLAREEEYVFRPPPQLYVSGTVTDAVTGEKVKSFHVVPGVDYDQGPNEIRRGWHDQDTFKGSDGNYRIKHRSPTCHAHLIRIEADGYMPIVSRKIASDEGEVVLDFKLEPAKMIGTRVIDSQGKPAHGALLIISADDSYIEIHNGRRKEGISSNAPQFKTDENGDVQFSQRLDPFQLIVLHDRGFARVVAEDKALPQQIKLTDWSVVKGRVLIGGKSAKAALVELGSRQFESQGEGVPFVRTIYRHTTDTSGNFHFDRVFPGTDSIYWKKNLSDRVVSSSIENLITKAGETRRLQLGGGGLQVSGRLMPPESLDETIDWSDFRLALKQNINIVRIVGKAYEPQPYYNLRAVVSKDGTFKFNDVPAGDWFLQGYFVESDKQLMIDAAKVTIASYEAEERELGDIATRVKP